MKNAIIVHGTCSKKEYYADRYPSPSNSHWIPWLQQQLLMRDVYARTPEMFRSFLPDYDLWRKEFERSADIDEYTILVGHSCGGGFIIRWLSENKRIKVGRVILVAPWLDPDHTKGNDFFDFEIDPHIAHRTEKLVILNSTNDMESVKKSLMIIKEHIKDIVIKDFENYGHFCHNDLKGSAFPELLTEIIN